MSHTDTPCAHLLPTHHGSPQPSYSPKPLHAPPSHPNPRIDTLLAIVLTQQLHLCRPRPRLPSRGTPGPNSLHAALQVAVALKAAVAALKTRDTASPCLLDKPPEQASATLAAAALLRHPHVLPLSSSSPLPCLLLFSHTPGRLSRRTILMLHRNALPRTDSVPHHSAGLMLRRIMPPPHLSHLLANTAPTFSPHTRTV